MKWEWWLGGSIFGALTLACFSVEDVDLADPGDDVALEAPPPDEDLDPRDGRCTWTDRVATDPDQARVWTAVNEAAVDCDEIGPSTAVERTLWVATEASAAPVRDLTGLERVLLSSTAIGPVLTAHRDGRTLLQRLEGEDPGEPGGAEVWLDVDLIALDLDRDDGRIAGLAGPQGDERELWLVDRWWDGAPEVHRVRSRSDGLRWLGPDQLLTIGPGQVELWSAGDGLRRVDRVPLDNAMLPIDVRFDATGRRLVVVGIPAGDAWIALVDLDARVATLRPDLAPPIAVIGEALFCNDAEGRVVRVDLPTGEIGWVGPALVPEALVVAPGGRLFALGEAAARIDPDTGAATWLGAPLMPTEAGFDAEGDLWSIGPVSLEEGAPDVLWQLVGDEPRALPLEIRPRHLGVLAGRERVVVDELAAPRLSFIDAATAELVATVGLSSQ